MGNDQATPASSDRKHEPLSRRKALARLGLAAGTAYVAPLLTNLRSAKADDDGGPPWGGGHHSRPCHGHGDDCHDD